MNAILQTLDPLLVAELLGMGVVAGFLAGMFGIGGGMMMVPVLLLVFGERFAPDYGLKMAVATSLATILFTSLSSVRAHQARGAVRWDLVRAFVPGILVGSFGGAQVARWLPGRLLAGLFAGFVAYSAVQMLRNRKPKATRQLPGTVGLVAVGGVAGLLSALVGAGGGFLTVPFMIWCNVPIHNAVGTSAALGFPIALAGTVGYVLAGRHLAGTPPGAFGYVYVPALLLIAATSMLAARFGVQAAHRLDVAQLRRGFAILLMLLAAFMVSKAVGG